MYEYPVAMLAFIPAKTGRELYLCRLEAGARDIALVRAVDRGVFVEGGEGVGGAAEGGRHYDGVL